MSTLNRFAVLDDSDDEVEVSSPIVEKVPDAFVAVVDESGSWEKPVSRSIRKAAVFAAKKAGKKLHAACMKELLMRVQMRMLYAVLIREWKEQYDYAAQPRRTASLGHALWFRAQSLRALCTAPPRVVSLKEERQVGGYCESCAEYAHFHTGWTIEASVAVAKMPQFMTALQTGFIPKLQGWKLVGTNVSLKSATVSMKPMSLLTLGPDSEVLQVAVNLKFEIETSSARRECETSRKTRTRTLCYGDSWCLCYEPRGCGRQECCCELCDEMRAKTYGMYGGYPEHEAGIEQIRASALEFIRRFFVRTARIRHLA